MPIKDKTGQVFGRLVDLRKIGISRRHLVLWECRCDCGNMATVNSDCLTQGSTRSCGCLRRERTIAQGHANRTHGGTHTSEYGSYLRAKARCNNPNWIRFKDWGGRGIEFRFANFEEFLAELGLKPEPKHLYSTERIENNGHYEKGNVCWATAKQQAANRRNSKSKA